MNVVMATSPGHDRPNEDFVGAVPGPWCCSTAPESQGAKRSVHTVSPGTHTRSVPPCSGTCPANPDAIWSQLWPTRSSRWPGGTGTPATSRVPSAPRRPSRSSGTTEPADFLVLADTFIVTDSPESGPQVLTDPREVDARSDVSSRLQGLATGTPDYERATLSATEELRSRRNRPGGYWIAKDDPEAAAQAVTGSVPPSRCAAPHCSATGRVGSLIRTASRSGRRSWT